jgi:rod shape-determining protein MreC
MTRTRNTVVLLVVASLTLILWDLRASNTTVRAAAQEITAPLQRTATALFAPLGAWSRDVAEFSDPVARSAAAARIEAPKGWRSVPVRVVAVDIAGDRATVTVDAGAAQGVREDHAVLAVGGLVGRTSEVFEDTARVILVTDPQSTLGVRALPSREMGVLTGAGMANRLDLDVFNPAAPVAAGQQIVTLGSTERDGVPPDLPVGTVARVDPQPAASGRRAEVRPVVGMTSLDTLLVLTDKT